MSIDLNKAVSSVGIVLTKREMTKVPVLAVCAAIDFSPSMRDTFRSGIVQDTLDRILAIAIKFDDDGELPVFLFSSDSVQCDEDLNISNRKDYLIKHERKNRQDLWDGTSYEPAMQQVCDIAVEYEINADIVTTKVPDSWLIKLVKHITRPILFTIDAIFHTDLITHITLNSNKRVIEHGTSKKIKPTMCFFITDGESFDERDTLALVERTKNAGIFWVMVGVGSQKFQFLERLANFNHVSYIKLASLNISDNELYEQIISEKAVKWLNTNVSGDAK